VRERVMASIKETEARATLPERGARESATSLASTHGEADEAISNVAHLEGEHADAHQAQDMPEAKLPGLADRAAHADQQREDAKR
jgi:hypothetical protein